MFIDMDDESELYHDKKKHFQFFTHFVNDFTINIISPLQQIKRKSSYQEIQIK